MIKVNAKIESFIYEATDSVYKVIKGIIEDENEIVLTGYFPLITLGFEYEFQGEYINHPKFGSQFKVSIYKQLDINTKEGIVAYLSSDLFKGIGPVTASKIYDLLGENCINKIIDDKNILLNISGLTKKKIDDLYNTLIINRSTQDIYVELYNYGLTPKMALKLFEKYDFEVINKINENPYRLIYEIEGFGFLKSDSLAMSIGYSYDSKIRIEEGILYTLNNVCNNNGFVFLTKIQLINSSSLLLNKRILKENHIDNTYISNTIDYLIKENKIIEEENRLYLKYLYEAEDIVAKKVLDIVKYDTKKYDNNLLINVLNEVKESLDIEYTISQKEAILMALNNNISIITGGPGTGKTTIIKGILNILARLDNLSIVDRKFTKKVLLCAPTGRASKRLQESCGIKAETIHKALGYNYENEFLYNEDNLLSESIIIIDEASMIDIVLASHLFSAISKRSKIIIVGDVFQLPSVGPGNVLSDLIDSNIIKTCFLKEIMRQAYDSDIVKLSLDIKNNYVNYNIFKNNDELYFYNANSQMVIDKIVLFVDAFIKKGGDLFSDLQILAPMYSGVCGIDAINKVIQEKFNLSEEKIIRGNKIFKLNDKVLQTHNDSTLKIMNGDIGRIIGFKKYDDLDYLIIEFDDIIVEYPSNSLENLTLAYAISVHKSQGNEYKNVIMPIVMSYYIMLKRKLIYTAITRAKNKLIIIGEFNSLVDGIKKSEENRQTTLMYRLKNLNQNKNVIYINDDSIPFKTLGEDGMENITPYTFMKK